MIASAIASRWFIGSSLVRTGECANGRCAGSPEQASPRILLRRGYGRSRGKLRKPRRLVELRDRWLNPPEWIEWVDEPVPGYPKRPVPRDGDAAKELKKRTLTNLYNARLQWLADNPRSP